MAIIFKKAGMKPVPKPAGQKRFHYYPWQLANYLGISLEEVHAMVKKKIGPQPIDLMGKEPYCFTGDCVEMWIAKGKPNILVQAPILSEVWMIRKEAMTEEGRVRLGGPKELPPGFKFQDFSIKEVID